MASRRPRSRTGVRILTGVVRVLAAVILAIAASAALADLNLQSVDFYRVLPVVLTGEGIVYILMLGGGSVAGPVLLLTVLLTFTLRAGIAVGAAALSPQAGADLMAGAQFYYAAYWPSAVAQVLMMAIMLRLVRPLLRRRRRRVAPQPTPDTDDAEDEERRDLLLVALSESPDEPPESPTALEEQQIGDLTEVAEAKQASPAPVAEEMTLPFDEDAAEEPEAVDEEAAVEEAEPEEEAPLPPGVIDARPGVAESEEPETVDEEAPAEEAEPEEEAPLPPGVIDARPGVAESEEPEAVDEEAPAEEAEPEEEVPLPPGVIDARPGVAESEEPETVDEEAAVEEVEPEDEVPLPPGVIDARPGVADSEEPETVDEEAAVEEVEPEDEVPLPPGVIDARPGVAESEEPEPSEAEEAPQPEAEAAGEEDAQPETVEATAVAPPGEETERLEPVQAREAEFDLGEVKPPENLQQMVSVISEAAGEGCEVRVWGTSDGRTVLAAVPAGTPAAGTATHADALVNTHLRLCERLGTDASCQQLAVASLGGWVVQALDPYGGVMLVMATRDDSAIGRLQLAAGRTADALRGMAAAAGAVPRPQAEGEIPLSPEEALSASIASAAHAVGGRFVDGWRVWRGPHRHLVAAIAPPGGDPERVAEMAAQAIAPVERFADAIALDRPRWLATSCGSALLVLVWAEIGGEAVVMSALASGEAAIGRARWELAEIARQAAE